MKISDLSNYKYNYTANLTLGRGFANGTLVKSPSITITSGQDGRYLFYNQYRLYEATIDPTNANDSSNYYLKHAFSGCHALIYVHMPENSVKRQIDLSAIGIISTDAEPRDNTMTVSQYA